MLRAGPSARSKISRCRLHWGELYVIAQPPEFPHKSFEALLNCIWIGTVSEFDVADPLVKNLPRKPAQAMHDGPDRFVVTQSSA